MWNFEHVIGLAGRSEARYGRLKSIKSFGWSEKIFFRKKGLDIQFGF